MFTPTQEQYFKDFINDLQSICEREDRLLTEDKNISISLTLANKDKIERDIILSQPTVQDSCLLSLDFNVAISNLETRKRDYILMKDLMKIPVYTRDGMKINGARKQLIQEISQAKGWQIERKKEETILSYRPNRGKTMRLYVNNQGSKSKLVAKIQHEKNFSANNTTTVRYSTLLKALFNEINSDELRAKVTSGNPSEFILFPEDKSYNESDLILDNNLHECKRKVIEMVNQYNKFEDSNAGLDFMIENSKFFQVTDDIKERSLSLFSLTNRCKNQVLAKKIIISTTGEEFKSGVILTEEILSKIEKDNISSIWIKGEKEKIIRVVNCKEDGGSFRDFLVNVGNIYCCEMDGLKSIKNLDSIENKVVTTYYTLMNDYVEDSLDEIIFKLKRYLRSELDITKDKLISSLRTSFSDLMTGKNPLTCIRSFAPRNTMASMILENQMTSNVDNVPLSTRAVQETARGFIDATASPESSKVGITQNLAATTFIDKRGRFSNWYYKIDNGKTSDEAVAMDILTALKFKVTSERNKDSEEFVQYHINGTVGECKFKDCDFVTVSSSSMASRWASIGVGFEHNKSRRTQMSENQGNQYHMIIGAERRLVTTGIPSTIKEKNITCRDIVNDLCILNNVEFSEEYCEEGIRLVNISHEGERLTLEFEGISKELYDQTCTKNVDWMANFDQLTWSYDLNLKEKTEPIWRGDEIVVKPIDVVVESKNISEKSTLISEDKEHEIMCESVKKHELATGLNLITAYISYKGYCYEDGVLIRRGLVESLRTANLMTHKLKFKLKEGQELCNVTLNTKLDVRGMPKANLFFEDGEEILGTRQTLTSTRSSENDELAFKDRSYRVKDGYSGYVISSTLKIKDGKQFVEIVTGSIKLSEIGDKYTGYHGDKGVCVMILDDSKMPCLADGTPVDICVNPLSMPSRMNLGSILEGCSRSYNKLSKMKSPENEVILVPPFSDFTEITNDICNNEDNSELTDLYDPETLSPFPNKVSVVYRYFMKLDHNVEKKQNSIASPMSIDPKTGQPKKSELFPGGQSLSELGTLSLIANGAYKTLDYLMGAGSDDLVSARKMEHELEDTGKTYKVGKNNTNFLMNAYLIGMGYMIEEGHDFSLKLISDDMIDELAYKISLTPDLKIRDSLYSNPVMFNPIGKPIKELFTYYDCGNFAWVNPILFSDEICKMFTIKEITSTGIKYSNMTSIKVKELLKNEAVIYMDQIETNDFGVLDLFTYEKVNKNSKYTNGVTNTRYSGRYSGMPALYMLVKGISSENYQNLMDFRVSILSDKNTNNQWSGLIENILKLKRTLISLGNLEGYITNKLIVIPRGYRYVNEDENQEDGVNKIYKYLLNCVRQVTEIPENMKQKLVEDFSSLEDVNNMNRFYIALLEMCTKAEFTKTGPLASPDLKTLVKLLSAKEIGVIRGSMFSKKIAYSFRSVIVGSPDCELNKAFIPKAIIMNTYKHKIFYWLCKSKLLPESINPEEKNRIYNIIESVRVSDYARTSELLGTSYSQAEEFANTLFVLVNKELENELVILIREPVLVRTNTQAFIPVMWEARAIGINTLICEGYNADFDGDQMAGLALMSEVAKEDARKYLTPSSMLKEAQNGGDNFNMKFDVVLGFYSATQKEPDLNNLISEFNDTEELEREIKLRKIRPDDTFRFIFKELNLDTVTTAGRMFTALKLPRGKGIFEKEGIGHLRFNKALDKKMMSKITELYKDFSEVEQIFILNDIKNLGFLLQDLNNVSLSFEDFHSIFNDERYTKLYNSFSYGDDSEIQTMYELLITEGMFNNTISARREYLKYRANAFMSTIRDIVKPESNLGKIFNSGSRGTFENFLETLVHNGYIKGVGDVVIETPIMNSLYVGYSPEEYATSGHEARRSTTATTKGTQEAGELNRMYGFEIGDIKIIEADCGEKPQKHNFLLKLELPKDLESKIIGRKLDANSEAYGLFGDKKLDVHSFEILEKELVRDIIMENGEKIKFNYLPKTSNEKLYENRYGYRVNDEGTIDQTCEVKLTKYDIQKYIDFGYNYIYCRMTWDCNCVGGVCVKCFGNLIQNENEPYVGENVGIISTQSISQTMVQLNLDVKNSRSDSENNTGGLSRLKSILNMSKGTGKIKAKYDPNAIYTESDIYITVEDSRNDCIITYNKERLIFPKSRVVVGNGLFKKGTMIVDGLNNYNKLNSTIEIWQLRELLFNEYYSSYERNGIKLHPKHFELLVKSQTSSAMVLKSDKQNVREGSYLEIAKIKELNKLGAKIEYKPCATSMEDSCMASGWMKAIAHKEISRRLSIALINGYRDNCKSVYSKITSGTAIGEYAPEDMKELEREPRLKRFKKELNKVNGISGTSRKKPSENKEPAVIEVGAIQVTRNFPVLDDDIFLDDLDLNKNGLKNSNNHEVTEISEDRKMEETSLF